MSDLTPNLSSGASASKGMFSRNKPENTVTAILLAVGAGLGIFFLSEIKTFILNALGTVVGLIGLVWALAGLGVSLLVIYWLLFGEAPRTIMWNLYKNSIRNIYRAIVAHDPVGITKNYIEKLKAQYEKAEFHRTKVNAELVGMAKDLKANEARAVKALEEANFSSNRGNARNAALLSTEASTLKESNEAMLPRYTQLQQVVTFLQRMAETADFELQRTMTMVGIKQKEYERMQSSGKALSAFQAIFGEDSEDRKMFDMAMEEMENSINFRTAEMDRLMNTYEGVLAKSEANKGVVIEHGMELLERFQNGENVSLDLNSALENIKQQSQSTLAPTFSRGTLPPVIDVTPIQETRVRASIYNNSSKWQ